jgi:pilus assembly protein CpaC
MKRGIVSRLRMAVLFLGLLMLLPGIAGAQEQEPLHVAVSSGYIIDFPRPVHSVFIADPSIADVQVPAKNKIIVYGKKPGQTSLFVVDNDDHVLASRQVIVGYDLSDLQRLLHHDMPNVAVELDSTPNGIVMTGSVPDADTAEKVRTTVKQYLADKQTLVDRLQVTGSQQVNLRVRVAEVSRTTIKDLGINWDAVVSPGSFSFGLFQGRSALLGGAGALGTSPPPNIGDVLVPGTAPMGSLAPNLNSTFANLTTRRANVTSLLDALAEEGLVTILAEPNLTTTSGQEASFLAGGEFPIPVAQSGTGGAGGTAAITIEFKQFGVSLDFVPTVLSSDRISIKVRPEVSELTSNGAVTIPGPPPITIPALNVRRAETTVELGSGQSFAIAGLIQNNSSTDINKYPGLGDVPVLGTLFRSSAFQRNESELVIIVTPYIVRPVSKGTALKLPTDGFTPASDLERIFLDRLTKEAKPGAAEAIGVGGARLHGDAGFIIE